MLMEAHAADEAIQGLQPMELEKVGTNSWMKQHMVIQRLNLQAHESLQKNSENFVLEGLVTHDKMATLIHELIVIEAWREKTLQNSQVFEHLATKFSIRGYHTAYQEAAICNLLEVVMYHDYVAQACGDTIIELVDYCCRRIRWLVENSFKAQENEEESVAEKDLNEKEEIVRDFKRQLEDIEWRCSVAAVSVLRFLCEHLTQLPLGVMTRMLDTHDVPCMVIPLIENPPWTRRNKAGQWEKFKDQKWRKVPPQDLLLLTSLEAQGWLILFNLLCEGEVKKRYHFHSFRKDSILRVRKYLNATLVDQLPVLSDLQRVMDELVILDAPPSTTKSLVLEQVAQIRETLMRQTNWTKQIELTLHNSFSGMERRDDPIVRELAGMYADDSIESLLSFSEFDDKDDTQIVGESAKPAKSSIKLEVDGNEPPKRIFPKLCTLLLQTGRKLELVPLSEFGTEQKTSQGSFLRFQLKSKTESALQMEDQENANQNGVLADSLNVSIDSADFEGSMLKMHVSRNDGESSEIFSKAAPCLDPAKPDFWIKLGSLKDGYLAQIQCTVQKGEGSVILGSAFLSLHSHT